MAKGNKPQKKKVDPNKKAAMKHEEKMQKLQNQGQSGYAARKMEAQRERQKTLRVTAVANAAREALSNRQNGLNRWNALINGEELSGGQQHKSVTDTTKGDEGESKEDRPAYE